METRNESCFVTECCGCGNVRQTVSLQSCLLCYFSSAKVKMSLQQGGRLPLHTLKNQSTVLIGHDKIIRRSGELASPFLLNWDGHHVCLELSTLINNNNNENNFETHTQKLRNEELKNVPRKQTTTLFPFIFHAVKRNLQRINTPMPARDDCRFRESVVARVNG